MKRKNMGLGNLDLRGNLDRWHPRMASVEALSKPPKNLVSVRQQLTVLGLSSPIRKKRLPFFLARKPSIKLGKILRRGGYLLFWFKGGKGTDLALGSRLDFTRGIKLATWVVIFAPSFTSPAQIGHHLRPAYHPVCIIFAHPPPLIAVTHEGFITFPVELPLAPSPACG